MDIPALNEKDEKCFEQIEKIIKGGLLETLKVDHCKIYLRKYGLRLTGKKDILLDRIKEHLEILDGNGEKKYPVSSFEIDCRGDACTGDVVLFEQNVYEMFSIASRSATAPSCGTRLVAGRIVKESYGMAKQQHTFTVEVLWSKGVKPWPPLHPLLIKGRNLYRLQTKRQRWADENERKKALDEKHSRGNVARSSREARIQQKQERKNLAGSTRLKKMIVQGTGDPNQKTSINSNPQDCQPQNSVTHLPNFSLNSQPNNLFYSRPPQNPAISQPNIIVSSQEPVKFPIKSPIKHNYSPLNPNHLPLDYRKPLSTLNGHVMSPNHQHHHGHHQWQHFADDRNKCGVMPNYPHHHHHPHHQQLAHERNQSVIMHHHKNHPNAQHGVCWHFAQGRCRYGSVCKFQHK
ncbi:zinc finger CCCH domain-containing protein 62 isoform X2 [Amborella trichopoda]|nr:zinc finger CCCH domain-containing protein 62 isoform X2 [Amborella trichopoda]XP_020522471.1 zinc finger CCCH domain-containing protein 62 isoform X2 [Amborella trichopoda]|eukprot:XP_011623117.1 zinc finger CCCH domain-containing protein 62 isoform X2 [Amborella trichopoda]